MSYNKTTHALISRISPKINPTLKQGYSSVCTSAKNIVLPATAIGALVDVANSVFTGCTPFMYITVPGTSYSIQVAAGEINKLVLDNGTILIPTPNGFKDVSGNENHSTSTTLTMTHLSDSSVFYLEEYGFATDAVNNCYPILVNRSGYAGLDPVSVVKTYPRGLISRKGSIDIEAWNLLDTLIDFGNSTAVKATGLRISEMDGVDCNLELIYVAEPKLDPAEVTLTAIDSITATVAKAIGGTTNGASVNIYYKLHSAGSWTLAGAGTVDTGAGTWTYNITIATADTYDIKVVDGTDADAYALQENVVVASGVITIQFGGSGYDSNVFTHELSDGSFVVVGRTKSPTMFGVNTYGAGLTRDSNKFAIFVNRLNANGTQFTGFTPFFLGGCTNDSGTVIDRIDVQAMYGTMGLVLSNSIYVVATWSPINAAQAIRKLSITTGAVESSINPTIASPNLPVDGIVTDGSYIYAHGSDGNAKPTIWRYPLDLSTQTTLINTSDDIGSSARSCSVCGTKLVFSSSNGTHRYTLTGTKEEYNTTIKRSDYGTMGLGSVSRWYVHVPADAKIYCYAVSNFSALWNQSIANTAQGTFRVLDNGNIAMAQKLTGTPNSFTVTTFQDADAYANVSAETVAVYDGLVSNPHPINKGGCGGSVDGKLVATSTDAGGYDGFIYKG